jgi:chaperonin cofactor prefoldin
MSVELRQKRDALELRVEALRDKKSSLAEDEYFAQLESLLLELARLYANDKDAGRSEDGR